MLCLCIYGFISRNSINRSICGTRMRCIFFEVTIKILNFLYINFVIPMECFQSISRQYNVSIPQFFVLSTNHLYQDKRALPGKFLNETTNVSLVTDQ